MSDPFARTGPLASLLGLAVASLPLAALAQGPEFEVAPIEIPAAAGSLAPGLSAGADGRPVLSWLEPAEEGYRLRFSVLEESWQAPRTVAAGTDWFINWADVPSVVPVGQGLLAAHWLVSRPAGGYAYDVYVSVSDDGGQSWAEPVRAHDDDTDSEHGFVSLFPHPSGFGAVWLDGRRTVPDPATGAPGRGMSLRGAVFDGALGILGEAEIDGLVCDCCPTAAVVTGSGVLAAYRDRSEAEVRDIHLARLENDAWRPAGTPGEDGWTMYGCPVNGPAVDAAGDVVALAWFTAAGDSPRIQIARSGDDGRSFSPPIEAVSGDTLGRAQVAVLEGGDLALAWLCKNADGSTALCLRRVYADGRLGEAHLIRREVLPLSFPRLLRHGDDLLLAYTVRAGRDSRIESVSLAADSLR